jgi:nucleoside-diphosphate-sugar epimerase
MRIVLFGATGKSGTRAADASNPDTVARLISGHDAVVLAVSPPRGGSESTESLLEVGRGVLDGVRKAGVRRLVVAGDARSPPVYGSSTPPGSPRTSCHGPSPTSRTDRLAARDWPARVPPPPRAPTMWNSP